MPSSAKKKIKPKSKSAPSKVATKLKEVRFKTFVRKFEGSSATHYLEIPDRIFRAFGGKYNVRVVASIGVQRGGGAKLSFSCALMPSGKGAACIMFSKEKLKISGLREGQGDTLVLKPETSRYGMPMPKELATALRLDPAGRKRFDKLSPGKQRNIIWYVTQTKSDDVRIDRAVQMIKDLQTLVPGKESMHELVKLEQARRKMARGEDASEELAAVPLVRDGARGDEDDFMSRVRPISERPRKR